MQTIILSTISKDFNCLNNLFDSKNIFVLNEACQEFVKLIAVRVFNNYVAGTSFLIFS